MTRSLLVFLAGLVAIAVLVAVCLAPAKSVTPSPYRALPTSAFSTWPVMPLARPRPAQSATITPSQLPAVKPAPIVRPGPSPMSGVSGTATWYQFVTGQAAAAKPLRSFLGAGWRGEFVRVCHDGLCLRIRLTDYESSLLPGRLVDLSSSDFRRICGPLSRGVCQVTVSH